MDTVFMVILLANLGAAYGQARCPPPFVNVHGKCYKYVDDKKNFHQAVDNCKALGGFLAEPKSQKEFDAIKALAEENDATRGVWIGGVRIADSWSRWITSGKDMTYLPWTSGQPDGSGRCLWMWKKHDYGLDDYFCNAHDAESVCQATAFPYTTTDRGQDCSIHTNYLDTEFEDVARELSESGSVNAVHHFENLLNMFKDIQEELCDVNNELMKTKAELNATQHPCTAPPTIPTTKSSLPEGFEYELEEFADHRYLLSAETSGVRNVSTLQARCKELGGYLVEFDTYYEYAHVFDFLRHKIDIGNKFVAIGLTHEGPMGQGEWVYMRSRSPAKFLRWDRDQPVAGFNCAFLWGVNELMHSFGCYEAYGRFDRFMCEVPTNRVHILKSLADNDGQGIGPFDK